MHLIIAEKNISARRIAEILAGKGRVSEKRDGNAAAYEFGDTVAVGLRGHVVEVDFVPGYSNWRSEKNTPRSLIDAGTCKVPIEKKIISLIHRLAKKADRVTIATDFDTEGELIGKEAYEIIRAVNPKVPIDRSRFSAITPDEIRDAFSHPTELDFALAAAGEARQIIDLVWGASLTRFISIAAKRGGQNILSVGRVQSPTLAMIVDREREIESFVPETYWQLSLLTEKEGETIEARHATTRFTDRAVAETARDRTRPPLTVTEVKEGSKVDRAPTPFDTTSFIVAAGRIGLSAANAMRIAEDLYVNGFISYPRTDNTVYPKTLDLAGVLSRIRPTVFSREVEWVLAHRRPAPTQGKKSSTDHPPIHPTGPATRQIFSEEQWKVYELVVRRFLATLSPDARWATMKVTFSAGGEPYIATGGRLVDPGWRTVYPYSEAQERILPVFTSGEQLPIRQVDLQEKQTQPPSRYSQSKLIQVMEELGLGTKSTRHEVIAKLINRKYVEGNPMRPTLVGRAVVESLENHADTITLPDMTRTLETHMQLIKEGSRDRDHVVSESREMLHTIFDQLESHEEEIGNEIREQTAEELTIGACPVCGKDLRIRHMRGNSQFIGCTGYPDCSFNISLPSTQWGLAIATDQRCDLHGLNFIRLVRRGARPWEIGCPFCHHLTTNRETLMRIAGMDTRTVDTLFASHIYTVVELAGMTPDALSARAPSLAGGAPALIRGAQATLAELRRMSECRKFVRTHIPPRRGRSTAAVMKKLLESGVRDIESLAGATVGTIQKSGIGEQEAEKLIEAAKKEVGAREFKDLGLPGVSVKKYQGSGFLNPDMLLAEHPAYISIRSGVSPDTVSRHLAMVALARNRQAPPRITKARFEKGRAGLLAVKGIGDAVLERLFRAGVTDTAILTSEDPSLIAHRSGIAEEKIREYAAHAAGR